jgi:hypothetical protein
MARWVVAHAASISVDRLRRRRALFDEQDLVTERAPEQALADRPPRRHAQAVVLRIGGDR